jgi:hypothetical protein
MLEAATQPAVAASGSVRPPRLLGIFRPWRLQAYGYTLAALYVAATLYMLWLGVWLLGRDGLPVYHDFTCGFAAGWLALHGAVAALADPAAFVAAQEALVGPGKTLFSIWPYPPSYFLLLAPLAPS